MNDKIKIGSISVFFLVLYSSISLVNHYLFRTYALDLGVFNNAMFDFAHFRSNELTLLIETGSINYFAAHISLITLIISPLYWIFGSYTLLIAQVFSIIVGGVGIYRYATFNSRGSKLPLLVFLHFMGLWGIYSALAFDFHENVIASMLVPWFIYYSDRKKYIPAIVFFILILVAKENMALWLVFINLGLWIKGYKKGEGIRHKFNILLASFSLLYFIVVIVYIMPFLQNHQDVFSQLNRYSPLGGSLKEIFVTLFSRPKQVFSLLFENTTGGPVYSGIKPETWFVLLLSGGFTLFFKPCYFVMLLPVIAWKMFSGDYGTWGINGQYSIEFAPILSLSVFEWLKGFERGKMIKYGILITILTYSVTFSVLDSRVSKWYNPECHRFYQGRHYTQDFRAKGVHEALSSIPRDASVSAMSPLVPHLACRDKIYCFPRINGADYIVLFRQYATYYPLSEEEYRDKINEIESMGYWVKLVDDNNLLIYKREIVPTTIDKKNEFNQ